MGTKQPLLDQTGLEKNALADESGFVSPGVTVGFESIVEGTSITLRRVLWSGIDLEGLSWSGAVCHSIIGLSL